MTSRCVEKVHKNTYKWYDINYPEESDRKDTEEGVKTTTAKEQSKKQSILSFFLVYGFL